LHIVIPNTPHYSSNETPSTLRESHNDDGIIGSLQSQMLASTMNQFGNKCLSSCCSLYENHYDGEISSYGGPNTYYGRPSTSYRGGGGGGALLMEVHHLITCIIPTTEMMHMDNSSHLNPFHHRILTWFTILIPNSVSY
jgi:hypothetical protein